MNKFFSSKMKKILPIIFISIIFLIILIYIGNYIFEKSIPPAQNIKIGITFSPNLTKNLGLDWKVTYLDILDNLKVRSLRLTSYWTDIEPTAGKFSFADLDYQLNEAQKRGASVMLVVGAKQPGWPECYAPTWAKSLTLAQRQQKTLDFLAAVIDRYKDHQTITKWQLENEPLFAYGYGCDQVNQDFLKKELTLVKKLDSKRPVVITDSGELSFWTSAMQASDIFGTTMYRTVHNPFFGYATYPLSPGFYNLKSTLIRTLFAPENLKTIITELQAEPWFSQPITQVPIQTQAKIFSVQNLKDNVDFARKVGFDEIYLWGAQWWYFMDKMGYPQYLEYGKSLF